MDEYWMNMDRINSVESHENASTKCMTKKRLEKITISDNTPYRGWYNKKGYAKIFKKKCVGTPS